MTEDEAIGILKTMCTDNFCIEQLKTKQAIETILAELEKKDKIINAMALQLSGISIWDDEKEEPIILNTEEEVKQHFERKVKDE